ncbi:ParE toxin of type II toxin-antitoxin system, parDE [compost metagenome]
MVRIKWLKSAKTDLKDIFDYIAKDSKNYAKLQVERIVSRTQILHKHFFSGKIVEYFNDSTIRELIEGNYRIIYRIVSSQEVHILMIHHSARDLSRRTPP